MEWIFQDESKTDERKEEWVKPALSVNLKDQEHK